MFAIILTNSRNRVFFMARHFRIFHGHTTLLHGYLRPCMLYSSYHNFFDTFSDVRQILRNVRTANGRPFSGGVGMRKVILSERERTKLALNEQMFCIISIREFLYEETISLFLHLSPKKLQRIKCKKRKWNKPN